MVLLVGSMLAAVSAPAWAQGAGNDKKVYNGPSTTSLGPWQLVLGEDASAEVEFQADNNRVVVRTLKKTALLVTAARYLVILENQEGTLEATLPTGRKVAVQPNNVDIVGRALADDPGQIQIQIAGLGAGTVSLDSFATALSGVVTTPSPINPVTGPRAETSGTISPTTLSKGFGVSP